jgi:hypothetical protein
MRQLCQAVDLCRAPCYAARSKPARAVRTQRDPDIPRSHVAVQESTRSTPKGAVGRPVKRGLEIRESATIGNVRTTPSIGQRRFSSERRTSDRVERQHDLARVSGIEPDERSRSQEELRSKRKSAFKRRERDGAIGGAEEET